jgi:hypothetical protein
MEKAAFLGILMKHFLLFYTFADGYLERRPLVRDQQVCDRWVENPYFQFFTGEEFFFRKFPHERSDLCLTAVPIISTRQRGAYERCREYRSLIYLLPVPFE